MNGDFCYSGDSENYTGAFDSAEEAIAEALCGHEDGDRFWIGRAREVLPEQWVEADDIIDVIANSEAFAMECAESWPKCTKEQKQDLTDGLQKLVAEWIRKHHLEPDFFGVGDSREFVVREGAAMEVKL